MLDGLHEDLNRVTDKKYVEDVESDGSGDLDEVAVRAWSGYLERNRSIVVDLFQGQVAGFRPPSRHGRAAAPFRGDEPIVIVTGRSQRIHVI